MNTLRLAGVCGVVAPVIAFVCIFAAIGSWSAFSWTGNALSDLGVQSGATAVLFNSGLIVCGVLCMGFAVGLFLMLGNRWLGKIGTSFFAFACLMLIAIGIFNESFRPTHYIVSVGFFVSLPLSLWFLVAALWLVGERKLGVFTLALGLAAATPWILQFTVPYVSGVAIPEAVSGLAGALWAEVLSVRLLKTKVVSSQK